MYLSLLCSFALFSICQADIKYADCGSKVGKPTSVEVVGCANTPCPLKKGTTVNLKIGFSSGEATEKLTAVVHGLIAGIPVPFPIPNPDACHNSSLTCPLTSGTNYVYTQGITVLKEYPSISVIVKWELKDAKGIDMFCIELPVSIVS